jgi:hypothetical protein
MSKIIETVQMFSEARDEVPDKGYKVSDWGNKV